MWQSPGGLPGTIEAIVTQVSPGDISFGPFRFGIDESEGVIMMVPRKIQVVAILGTGVALMLGVVPVAMCQATSDPQQEPAAAGAAAENADKSEKSLSRLRDEFYSAEQDFYGLFNSINSSDDFDVHCLDEVPFGRGKKEHACKAAFLRQYEARLASKYSKRMSRIGEDSLPSTEEIDRKQEQLRNEISSAVSSHPQLQKLYFDLVRAKKDYEARQ